jgi:hypothetical protein
MAATCLFILSVLTGARNQKMADSVLASVWIRCKKATMLLTDGWACYWSASAFLREATPASVKAFLKLLMEILYHNAL